MANRNSQGDRRTVGRRGEPSPGAAADGSAHTQMHWQLPYTLQHGSWNPKANMTACWRRLIGTPYPRGAMTAGEPARHYFSCNAVGRGAVPNRRLSRACSTGCGSSRYLLQVSVSDGIPCRTGYSPDAANSFRCGAGEKGVRRQCPLVIQCMRAPSAVTALPFSHETKEARRQCATQAQRLKGRDC